MILVDFSHLSSRNLYMAISQSRPKKVDGKFVTEDFIEFYYHLMLQSLRHISDKFGKKYGEIVLALDAKNNWRKDVYPPYKSHRKKDRDESDIDFTTFFSYAESFILELDQVFPYKTLRVEKAEADDIIGILAKQYSAIEKVLVVSSDKDFKQVLEYGAELYDPIKKKFVKMSPKEVKDWKIIHILCGDDSDGVPHIKRGTQFTDTFLAYLKENEIYAKTPLEFNELSISEKLYNEFDIPKKNKKGEELTELDIFKATPFGPAGATKFANDLKENLKVNKIYVNNFKRNMELVLFDYIPENIKEKIIQDFKNLETSYDPNGIFKFLSDHSLTTHLMNISDFYIDGDRAEKSTSSSLMEWM